ncbi:uncharacterized protein LOC133882530 [Alnus glutinosa]|uniref:uncharacterized protein LOC133882530 n=1 Tax=Alnus glutinosa TaxID=3517 RepID=UPI002D781DF9|nr:uncharacterized protein LOC133882530 [Alnus glutinosa]
MEKAMGFLLLLFLSHLTCSNADEANFDVRQHLSTVTRYGVVKEVAENSFVPSNIPDGCNPIHLNLVARHGTRSPTEKWIQELNKLEANLKELLRGTEEQKLSLEKVPPWLRGWESPWKGKSKGGELIKKGEEELYDLGIRIREKFPDIFNEEYHPDVYAIRATQVGRASASAVAFGMGLFSGKGNLGPGSHRAFAVNCSGSPANDTMLRFFDSCKNYKDFKNSQKRLVRNLTEPILDEITSALVSQYRLNFTRNDTSSLWFLCKQQASLRDITDQACSLFSRSEIELLEWTDDLELFKLKGYGEPLNYQMGVPLLQDVWQAIEEAKKAQEEKQARGSYEKARLRFAHAETVVPFSCLLGLFQEGSGYEQRQREQPLELHPPKPPQKRNWRGSTVAPFAGNNMLVLYSCPANSSSKYFVQVLHNEHPIPMPGCDGSDFCPLQVFKERIVAPHLKIDYTTVCTKKPGITRAEPFYNTSKLSQLGNDDKRSRKDEL